MASSVSMADPVNYNKLPMKDINNILVSVFLRSADAKNPEAGGNKKTKIAKLLRREDGVKLLRDYMVANPNKKYEAERQKVIEIRIKAAEQKDIKAVMEAPPQAIMSNIASAVEGIIQSGQATVLEPVKPVVETVVEPEVAAGGTSQYIKIPEGQTEIVIEDEPFLLDSEENVYQWRVGKPIFDLQEDSDTVGQLIGYRKLDTLEIVGDIKMMLSNDFFGDDADYSEDELKKLMRDLIADKPGFETGYIDPKLERKRKRKQRKLKEREEREAIERAKYTTVDIPQDLIDWWNENSAGGFEDKVSGKYGFKFENVLKGGSEEKFWLKEIDMFERKVGKYEPDTETDTDDEPFNPFEIAEVSPRPPSPKKPNTPIFQLELDTGALRRDQLDSEVRQAIIDKYILDNPLEEKPEPETPGMTPDNPFGIYADPDTDEEEDLFEERKRKAEEYANELIRDGGTPNAKNLDLLAAIETVKRDYR